MTACNLKDGKHHPMNRACRCVWTAEPAGPLPEALLMATAKHANAIRDAKPEPLRYDYQLATYTDEIQQAFALRTRLLYARLEPGGA